jgi:hypothetical protein
MATGGPLSRATAPSPTLVAEASSFLAPIAKPKGLILRIMYRYSRRWLMGIAPIGRLRLLRAGS